MNYIRFGYCFMRPGIQKHKPKRNTDVYHHTYLELHSCSKTIIFDFVIWVLSLSLIKLPKNLTVITQLLHNVSVRRLPLYHFHFFFVCLFHSFHCFNSFMYLISKLPFFFSFLVHFTCQINNISVYAVVFVTEDMRSLRK